MIAKSKTAHRLPFVLDAILKEDIDETSLDSILTFVGKNLPDDTQTFISISEHVKYDSRIFADTMHSCFKGHLRSTNLDSSIRKPITANYPGSLAL